jgi:hypothetical protein
MANPTGISKVLGTTEAERLTNESKIRTLADLGYSVPEIRKKMGVKSNYTIRVLLLKTHHSKGKIWVRNETEVSVPSTGRSNRQQHPLL